MVGLLLRPWHPRALLALEWALLIAASFFASIVDSSVGGGGIIRLPALLAFGLPPHVALGTNKFGSTGASAVSAAQYWRSGLLQKPLAAWGALVAALASVGGAWLVLQVAADTLTWLIIGAITLLLAYTLVQPRFGLQHRPLPVSRKSLLMGLGLALVFGAYDGFLGPGTGTFLILGFVSLLGQDIRHAAAHGRLLNFGSNVGGLALFAAMGYVDWLVGAAILGANIIGGLIGSTLTLRVDIKWIRRSFLLVSVALLVYLLWQELG